MTIFKPSHGIAFDIDGITLDTPTAMWEIFTKHLGKDIPLDKWTAYEIPRDLIPLSTEELRELYEPVLQREDLPMLPGAAASLQWLHAQYPDEALVFITARRSQFIDAAKQSIRRSLGPSIPFKVLSTTVDITQKMEWRENKTQLLKNYGVSLYFEDNPIHWEDYIKEGITIATFYLPWTRGPIESLITKYNSKLLAFRSWYEAQQHFENMGLAWSSRFKTRLYTK